MCSRKQSRLLFGEQDQVFCQARHLFHFRHGADFVTDFVQSWCWYFKDIAWDHGFKHTTNTYKTYRVLLFWSDATFHRILGVVHQDGSMILSCAENKTFQHVICNYLQLCLVLHHYCVRRGNTPCTAFACSWCRLHVPNIYIVLWNCH